MQLSVKSKQLDAGNAWRRHVEKALPDIVGKYFDHAQDAQVTLSKDGPDFRVDIAVHVGKRIMVQSHGVSGEARPAFEQALEKVGKILRRYKRRLRDHHKERVDGFDTLPAQQYVLASESDAEGDGDERDQPVIIAEMATEIETLSVGEAVMRMDLANLPVLMFRNRAHGGLNMVYYRTDGQIGWVDPRGNRASTEDAA